MTAKILTVEEIEDLIEKVNIEKGSIHKGYVHRAKHDIAQVIHDAMVIRLKK